jgi:hypothetical protein
MLRQPWSITVPFRVQARYAWTGEAMRNARTAAIATTGTETERAYFPAMGDLLSGGWAFYSSGSFLQKLRNTGS